MCERRYDVDAAQAGRLDRVVQGLVGCSRAELRGLFSHDCVTLNGEPSREFARPVGPGDVVIVRYDPHRRYREEPKEHRERAFRLVFEDQDLLVVDKAAVVLTVPTAHGETNTLLDAVTRYLSQRQRNPRVGVVHRLDRGTSGLLVFGKTPRVAETIQAQFRERKPERLYLALVAGAVEAAEGTFASRLATNKGLDRYSTDEDEENGEEAVTHYKVMRVVNGATLVQVRLETGRRNQIRVHFAEAGHPVLGETRYKPELARHPGWRAPRLALHAAVLAFRHPQTGEELRFESPLPTEFEHFLGKRSRPSRQD